MTMDEREARNSDSDSRDVGRKTKACQRVIERRGRARNFASIWHDGPWEYPQFGTAIPSNSNLIKFSYSH